MPICPHCKEDLDGRTQVAGSGAAEPAPGDFSFCFDCGQWAAFDADLNLRPLTEAETGEVINSRTLRVIKEEWLKLTRKYQ